MILGRGARLVTAGVACGLAASLALTRLLSSLLFGIRPSDPATFVLVALLLSGLSLAACYIPARKALRVDPVKALRYE
jgi:ABC-type antimicrobial peptide transport system permease subunit